MDRTNEIEAGISALLDELTEWLDGDDGSTFFEPRVFGDYTVTPEEVEAGGEEVTLTLRITYPRGTP